MGAESFPENEIIQAPAEVVSPEHQRLEHALQDTLGATSIESKNSDSFLAGKARFMYGFFENEQGEKGFLKVARPDSPERAQLLRETEVMNSLKKLSIPTVRVLTQYTQLEDGHGVVGLERLNSEDGEVLTNNELLASAPYEYAHWAMEAIMHASGKEIPDDMDISAFKQGDWRSDSAETHKKVWDENISGTINIPKDKQKILSEEQVATIAKLVETILPDAEAMINASTDSEKLFFVHNDASPNNTFFNTSKQEALLLDFEHSGVTHNKMLAQITDLGNFYGRSWPNPAFQKEFLAGIINSSAETDLEQKYLLARTVALFGSLFLAKYAMDPENKEHQMARSLLLHLSENMDAATKVYEQKKESLINTH